MRRDRLEHAIRTACQIIGQPAVAVVGSQSILGTYREDQLPAEATMSVEVDILPLVDDGAEAARLADLVEGVAGEWSPFEEQQHGFSIDEVDQDTAVLPEGWRARLVKVQNCNTAAPSGKPRYIGWCLDKKDLCVAKLCALREKDQNFVAALLDAGDSSTPRSTPHGWPPCQTDTLPPHNARSPGWMPGPESGRRVAEWFAQHDRSGPDASLREPRVLVAGDPLAVHLTRTRADERLPG